MCHGLNVHVLPFFKFYRGAEGKLCSFSCTIATVSKSHWSISFFISLAISSKIESRFVALKPQINKFKKALDKHGSERCSLGQAKGLDSKELMALASVGELKMDLDSLTVHQDVLSSSKASNFFYKPEEQHQKMVVWRDGVFHQGSYWFVDIWLLVSIIVFCLASRVGYYNFFHNTSSLVAMP